MNNYNYAALFNYNFAALFFACCCVTVNFKVTFIVTNTVIANLSFYPAIIVFSMYHFKDIFIRNL